MPVAKFFAALVGALVVSALLVRPACGCTTKTPGYYATMKADLRNLVTAQETFFADSGRYVRSLAEFGETGYQSSSGVTVELTVPGDTGWLASARHSSLTNVSCRLWIGMGSDAPDDYEGEPICDPPYKRKNWEFVWQ